MSFEYSRRDFLAGVLATGTASAVAIYLAPGGRPDPPVTLQFVSGADPTGARELLRKMWNRANPRTQVAADPALTGSTSDQKAAMISRVKAGTADILNLDIIDIPFFQQSGYLAPVELDGVNEFLPTTLIASALGVADPKQYWAAPFNADVGMLFSRTGATSQASDQPAPTLAAVVDTLSLSGSREFAAQLKPSSSASHEAFVVNVLEHALSRDDKILQGDDGLPARELEVWQNALQPLRAAVIADRITLDSSEDDSRESFRTRRLSYMRNWPVKYRELQQAGDPDIAAGRIRVDALPVGILGGQSLAIARNSPNADRAAEYIKYLTSDESQKILAAYGLVPTRTNAYTDPGLKAFIPHLERIRGAVEQARARPVQCGYSAFSAAVARHVIPYVDQGSALTTTFVNEIAKAAC